MNKALLKDIENFLIGVVAKYESIKEDGLDTAHGDVAWLVWQFEQQATTASALIRRLLEKEHKHGA